MMSTIWFSSTICSARRSASSLNIASAIFVLLRDEDGRRPARRPHFSNTFNEGQNLRRLEGLPCLQVRIVQGFIRHTSRTGHMGKYAGNLRGRGGRKEPLPGHVHPMLALLSELPREEDLYAFEYKWDGIRALFFCDGKKQRVETRNLHDVTHDYPELAPLADVFRGSSIVLDGEIVALNDKGRPSFGLLQHRLGLTESNAAARKDIYPVTYMIFDVLYLEGKSLTGLAYTQRREILESLALSADHW